MVVLIIRFTLAFILGLMLVLRAHAQDEVLELNTTTKPPLSTLEQTGFIDLVVKEALSRLGVTLRTVRLPAERALIDANSGMLDGEISRVAGLENIYTNLVRIPEKIMDLEFTLFSRHITHLEPQWQALTPYSTAIINGWKILENNIPANTEVTKVKSPLQLFNLLNLNRVDLIIYERWGGMGLIEEMKLSNIQRLKPPLLIKGMFMYVNKKHQALVPLIDNVLRDMKQDGTYQRIYDRTLGRFERH